MGEIGLAGELRRVRDLPQRLAEAARLGFQLAVVPDASPGRERPRSPESWTSTGCGSSRCPTSASALRLLDLAADARASARPVRRRGCERSVTFGRPTP